MPARSLTTCPKCGEVGGLVDRSELLGCGDDAEPELPAFLQVVYQSHSQLGTDQGGKPTLQEQREWFELYEVGDPTERRVWTALWSVVTAAKLTEAQRSLDEMRDGSE